MRCRISTSRICSADVLRAEAVAASCLAVPWVLRTVFPFSANDAGAKAFVQSLGESLHVELKGQGIQVMTLVVPRTDTTIIEKFGLDPATMPIKPMSTTQCVSGSIAGVSQEALPELAGEDQQNHECRRPRIDHAGDDGQDDRADARPTQRVEHLRIK